MSNTLQLSKALATANKPNLLDSITLFIPAPVTQASIQVLLDIIAVRLELVATDLHWGAETVLKILNGKSKKLAKFHLHSKYAKATFSQKVLFELVNATVFNLSASGYSYTPLTLTELTKLVKWLEDVQTSLALGTSLVKSSVAVKSDYQALSKPLRTQLGGCIAALPSLIPSTELDGPQYVTRSTALPMWTTSFNKFISKKKESYGYSVIRQVLEQYYKDNKMYYIYCQFAVKSTGEINLISTYRISIDRTTYKPNGAIEPLHNLQSYLKSIFDKALNP